MSEAIQPAEVKNYSLASDPYLLGQAVFYDPESVRERRRRVVKILIAELLFVTAGIFFFTMIFHWHFDQVWRYEAVGLLGASVGTAELLSRYKDAPSWVLLSVPGIVYISLNVFASLLALAVIQAFGWTFGAKGDGIATTQVLVAGLGSMALFRSSLLVVKVGSDDVGIGPSSVLSVLMAASDRSADRLRAADRAGRVKEIMGDVCYEKARDALPTVAVALMQNLSAAEVTALTTDLDGLKSKKLPDYTKSLLLGLKLTNMVSTEVLGAAKRSLGDSILCAKEHDTAQTNGDPGVKERAEVATAVVDRDPDSTFASKDMPQTPSTPDPPE
jgi:hypothetical protein